MVRRAKARRQRVLRCVVPVATLLSLGLLSTRGAAGAGPVASTAGGCSIPKGGEHLGPTYLIKLSVSATSCTTGLSVVRGYHECQLKHGGVKAKCSSSVDGFHCTEKRGPASQTEFFSDVSCSDRSARVSYTYSQFT